MRHLLPFSLLLALIAAPSLAQAPSAEASGTELWLAQPLSTDVPGGSCVSRTAGSALEPALDLDGTPNPIEISTCPSGFDEVRTCFCAFNTWLCGSFTCLQNPPAECESVCSTGFKHTCYDTDPYSCQNCGPKFNDACCQCIGWPNNC